MATDAIGREHQVATVQLDFVQPKLTEYKQYNDNFVPGLSIIDILMFNDKKVVKEMMKSYTLL